MKSLNKFLLARKAQVAETPTVRELIERIRERDPYEGPSSASVIRRDRDGGEDDRVRHVG